MSIHTNLPHTVGICKWKIPQTGESLCHTAYMEALSTNSILWSNVQRLMLHKYGKENLTRLARESGCGPGTASRIKEQKTSIGLEVLSKIGAVFDLEPWQLITPNLDPTNPPVIWLTRAERDLYTRLKGIAAEVRDLP